MKNKDDVKSREIHYVLSCLAVVLLSCALKNYLIFLLNGTIYCEYLCSSSFGRDVFVQPALINKFYQLQFALVEATQHYFNTFLINDGLNFFSGVIAVPLIEESIYRGPLYLSRNHSDSPLWWLAAVALVTVFVLSHNRSGLALLPVIALGFCSCWLIMVTKKFWPSLTLHFLYNFYFFSITLYQVMLWGE